MHFKGEVDLGSGVVHAIGNFSCICNLHVTLVKFVEFLENGLKKNAFMVNVCKC